MITQKIVTHSQLCLLVLLGLTLFVSPLAGQVFDSGPSDPALFDLVINLPPAPNLDDDESIGGFGTTQLNISDGGSVGRFFNANSGSELNISGGSVGAGFNANSGSEVNISGGFFDGRFDAFGSVAFSGGVLDGALLAEAGSVVSISGGSVSRSRVGSGGVINISGGSGSVGLGEFDVTGEANISGGNFGFFRAFNGSDVELIGGEFQLNGEAYLGDTISVSSGSGDVFTGTLADGSTFIFKDVRTANRPCDTRFRSDVLSDVQLTSAPLPTLVLSPIVVSTTNPNLPSGLRTGQTLTLQNGGQLGNNFEVVGATLNVVGGSLGDGADVSNSEVNISGGSVGSAFDALSGSVVNISGGSVDHSFDARSGSVVNISGGSVGGTFSSHPGSDVNISGGTLDTFYADSDVNISGGTLGTVRIWGGNEVCISGGSFIDVSVLSGSELNLFGSDFFFNGVPLLSSLTIGDAFTIDQRNGTLSGLLTDGSAFSFDLSDSSFFVSSDATLTVTLVPPVLLGDCNQNGEVNFLDIAAFIAILQAGDFLEQADINLDGEVNFLDIAGFITILQGQ